MLQESLIPLPVLSHMKEEIDKYFGNANAVYYGDDGKLYGGSDFRRDSKSFGY